MGYLYVINYLNISKWLILRTSDLSQLFLQPSSGCHITRWFSYLSLKLYSTAESGIKFCIKLVNNNDWYVLISLLHNSHYFSVWFWLFELKIAVISKRNWESSSLDSKIISVCRLNFNNFTFQLGFKSWKKVSKIEIYH